MSGFMIASEETELWLVIDTTGENIEVYDSQEKAEEQARRWNEDDPRFFTEQMEPGLIKFGVKEEEN